MTDRKIEKVFSATPGTTLKSVIAYGKFIYVCGTNKLYVYEYVGENAGHEFDMLNFDELNYNKLDSKLFKVTEVSIPNGCGHMIRGYTNLWITNSLTNWNKLTRVNSNTFTVTSFDAPETMISNLCSENGLLWCVGAGPTNQTSPDTNKLWIFNSNGATWSSVSIPVKKQLAKAQVTSGFNGFIYVTNFNNLSVSKFNMVSGAHAGTYRTNAYPQTIAASTDRGIFSGSYAGMLTKIDGLTDTVYNDHSTIDIATKLVPQDSQYVWFLDQNGKIGRLNRADNDVLLFPEDVDWAPIGAPLDFTVTLPFKYKQFNGTDWYEVDVKPHLVVIDSTKVHMIKLDKFIMVESTLEAQGLAMISTGPQDYMGEVG